jgi:hypothetical protein
MKDSCWQLTVCVTKAARINLSVFDTGNGTEKINDILKNPAVKEADLLIGAVQNEQIHHVAKFAEKEQNKICNSIHLQKRRCAIQSLCVSGKHPQSYLYSKAAQAGCELFKNYNIIILKVNDPQDDKKEFIQELKTELKQKKVSYKEYTYNAETFATEIESQFVTDKPNVIIPTSGTLNALNKIKTP